MIYIILQYVGVVVLSLNILALLRDLVFIWCKLYLRVKATEDFLQECKLLLLSATNVKAIFPFIKLIMTEVRQESQCVQKPRCVYYM